MKEKNGTSIHLDIECHRPMQDVMYTHGDNNILLEYHILTRSLIYVYTITLMLECISIGGWSLSVN